MSARKSVGTTYEVVDAKGEYVSGDKLWYDLVRAERWHWSVSVHARALINDEDGNLPSSRTASSRLVKFEFTVHDIGVLEGGGRGVVVHVFLVNNAMVQEPLVTTIRTPKNGPATFTLFE